MIEFTRTNGCDVVSLEVPGRIEYRDMVLRTVSASCKLIPAETRRRSTRFSAITAQIVSAVGEAFNNIVLHGYKGRDPGPVHVRIEKSSKCMRVTLTDSGASFHPSQAPPPDLKALPESGLGVFIMRSCVDEVTYSAGSPNVLTLVKRLDEGKRKGFNTPCRPTTRRS